MSKQNVPFPTEVTLGGVTYNKDTTPELRQFFEQVATAASQREKDTLYDTIEGLKSKNQLINEQLATKSTTLDTLKSAAQAQMQEYDNLKAQLEASRTGNANINLDANVIKAAITEAFQSTVPALMNNIMKPVTDLNQRLKADEIAGYKQKRIDQLEGKVIAEMISGETMNEIEESIQKAHELYKKYNPTQAPVTTTGNQIETAVNGQQQQQPAATTEQPVVTVAPGPLARLNQPANLDLPDYKNMSAEEYAKDRSAHQNKLRSLLSAMDTGG